MLQKTPGIVLHTVKYSETSVITSIYTKNYGQLSFIVQGVRSSKSKNKAALLQPMSILDLEIYLRENKNLLRLKEFRSDYIYIDLSFNVIKSSIGLFYIEVLHKVIKEQEPNTALFDFIVNEFVSLDKETASVALHPQIFLIKLSSFLGFQPRNNYSEQTKLFDFAEGFFTAEPSSFNQYMPPSLSLSFHNLLQALNHSAALPVMKYHERKELLQMILNYYSLHVSNFKSLNTLRVLEEVLS